MSVAISGEIQGLDQGMAELDRMMAADKAAEAELAEASKTGADTEDSGNSAQKPAGQTEGEDTQDPASKENKQADTSATAASQKEATEAAKAAEAAKKTAADQQPVNKSRYEKARERQSKSWDELNAQKEAFKAEKTEFEQAKAEYEKQRAEAEKEFSPEAYDQAAKKFEEDGKFDLAELAKAKAADLRKNPPKPAESAQKAKAEQEKQSKEWALKAGTDFPELVKTNSPLQVRVAQLFKEEPDLKSHPKGIYVAARIASLEAAAAGVAEKDKELGTLRARVKELEQLTSPGGGGSAATLPGGEKPFEQKSEDEQFADLEREALEMGSLA